MGARVNFMTPVTLKQQTRREVELAKSKVLSHNAKLVHGRRRAMKNSPPSEEDVTSSDGHVTTLSTTNSPLHKPGRYEQRSSNASISDVVDLPSSENCPPIHRSVSLSRTRALSRWTVAAGSDHLSRNTPAVRRRSGLAIAEEDLSSCLAQSPSPTLYTPDQWSATSDLLSDSHSTKLLHHCITVLWPGYEPPGSKLLSVPFANSWACMLQDGDVLFHASLWKAAQHLGGGTKIMSSRSIRHQFLAVQGIRKSLSRTLQTITEDLIYSILILSLPLEFGPAAQETRSKMGFNPPFQTLQWLNTIGKQTAGNDHQVALYHLLGLRGGIDTLTSPWLAGAIMYQDIARSTQLLCMPHFPLYHLQLNLVERVTRHSYFGLASEADIEQDQDFICSQLCTEDRFGFHCLRPDLLDAVEDVRVWVRVLRAYANNTVENPDLGFLAVRRNCLQHKVLSTLGTSESIHEDIMPEKALEDTAFLMNTLLQNGLLLFSIGVTFPIECPNLYKILANRLQAQVGYGFIMFQERELQAFGIWLCTLGGLASGHISAWTQRSWFVDAACRITTVGHRKSVLEEGIEFPEESLNFSWIRCSWYVIKETALRPLLWYDAACDSGAEDFWWQVQMRARTNFVRC